MKRIEKFHPGTYRNQGDFRSFVPAFVNDDWTWDNSQLNHLLADANKELGALNAYSELVPDIDTYIRMHIRVEANKSNRIEGTNTTIEEDMMPIEDVDPERRDDTLEVNNYIKAMNYGIHRITEDEFPFTSRFMREMHAILLNGVRGQHKTPGEFRTSQNFIGGSMPSNARYVPPSIIDMPDLVSDLDKFINREDDLPTLIKIAIIHYQFETIHPFLDGNGRIGRLIIPLFLLYTHELTKPCFYISDYFEQNRTQYYDTLQNVRVKGDMLEWIIFFLQASIQTAKSAKYKFRRAVQQVEEYKNYLITKRSGTDSLRLIFDALYKNPVSNVPILSGETGLSVPTVNSAVKTLVQDDILWELTGNRRNRVFALHSYISVFR